MARTILFTIDGLPVAVALGLTCIFAALVAGVNLAAWVAAVAVSIGVGVSSAIAGSKRAVGESVDEKKIPSVALTFGRKGAWRRDLGENATRSKASFSAVGGAGVEPAVPHHMGGLASGQHQI